MRLVLGLFVLCLAAPASAQSSFAAACVASAEGEGALPAGLAQRVCGCTEAAALAAGETAASLDRYQAFAAALTAEGLAAEAPPEWAVTTSSALMAGMGGCLAGLANEGAAAEPVGAPASEPSPEVVAVTAPPSGPAPARPAGLRTGDGGEPVRAVQQGNGAAVRIVE